MYNYKTLVNRQTARQTETETETSDSAARHRSQLSTENRESKIEEEER